MMQSGTGNLFVAASSAYTHERLDTSHFLHVDIHRALTSAHIGRIITFHARLGYRG